MEFELCLNNLSPRSKKEIRTDHDRIKHLVQYFKLDLSLTEVPEDLCATTSPLQEITLKSILEFLCALQNSRTWISCILRESIQVKQGKFSAKSSPSLLKALQIRFFCSNKLKQVSRTAMTFLVMLITDAVKNININNPEDVDIMIQFVAVLQNTKSLFAFGCAQEIKFVTIINDILWGWLGYVSSAFGNGKQRPNKTIVSSAFYDRLGIPIQFSTNDLKKTLQQQNRSLNVQERNTNVVRVSSVDIQNSVRRLIDNVDEISEDAEFSSICAIILQLSTGARFIETHTAAYMLLSHTSHVEKIKKEFQEFYCQTPCFSVAVFAQAKGGILTEEMRCRSDSIKSEIFKLQNMQYNTSEYLKQEKMIETLIRNYEDDFDKDEKLVYIPCKPVLFFEQKEHDIFFRVVQSAKTSSIENVNCILKSGKTKSKTNIFVPPLVDCTSHKLRHIYGNLSYEYYGHHLVSNNRWLQVVLGHGKNNIQTSLSYQTYSIQEGATSQARIGQLEEIILKLENKIDQLETMLYTLREDFELCKDFKHDSSSLFQTFTSTYGSVELHHLFLHKISKSKNVSDFEELYVLCKNSQFVITRKFLNEITKKPNKDISEILIHLGIFIFQNSIKKKDFVDSVLALQKFLLSHYLLVTPVLTKRIFLFIQEEKKKDKKRKLS